MKRKYFSYAIGFLGLLLLAQCKKTNNAAGDTGGAAGYNTTDTSVTLENGRITLEIPAGAMKEGTTIRLGSPTADFIDSTALLQSFQLLPEGTKFQKPVTLTLHYDSAWLKGNSLLNIGIAFLYDADGKWYAPMNGTIDSVQQTLSVKINHFSNWSIYNCFHLYVRKDAQISKDNARLIHAFTGETADLCVVMDFPPSWLNKDDDLNLLAPLVPVPDPEPTPSPDCPDCDLLAPLVPPPASFEEALIKSIRPDWWMVNGIDHGNAETGTIRSVGDVYFQYQAPGRIPSANPVAVTAGIQTVKHGRIYLVQHIQLIGKQWKLTYTQMTTTDCSPESIAGFSMSMNTSVLFHLDDQLNIVYDNNSYDPAQLSAIVSCDACIRITSIQTDQSLQITGITGAYDPQTAHLNCRLNYNWHQGPVTVNAYDDCTGGPLSGGTLPGAPSSDIGTQMPEDLPAQSPYLKVDSARTLIGGVSGLTVTTLKLENTD